MFCGIVFSRKIQNENVCSSRRDYYEAVPTLWRHAYLTFDSGFSNSYFPYICIGIAEGKFFISPCCAQFVDVPARGRVLHMLAYSSYKRSVIRYFSPKQSCSIR